MNLHDTIRKQPSLAFSSLKKFCYMKHTHLEIENTKRYSKLEDEEKKISKRICIHIQRHSCLFITYVHGYIYPVQYLGGGAR